MTPEQQQRLLDASQTLKFLANPNILLVLCKLGEGEKTAGELAELSGLSPSALSQHLRRMKDKNIVQVRREHRHMHYSLTDDNVKQLILALKDLYCA